MSVYKVDAEGVAALNGSANQVSEACEEIMSLIGTLESAANDNPDGLGPHVSELNAAIEEIKSSVQNSEAPAEEVCEALRSLASRYQEIIDNNPFK